MPLGSSTGASMSVRLHPVLRRDPWPSLDDMQLRNDAMRACLDLLRSHSSSKQRLSVQQVHDAVQKQLRHHETKLSINGVRAALERLRGKRLILGHKDTQADTDLKPGHPDYPYIYSGLPFQVRVWLCL